MMYDPVIQQLATTSFFDKSLILGTLKVAQ